MTALDIEPATDATEELERLRRQLDTATRQNRLLRGVAIADGRFTHAVLEGSGLGGVVSVLSELTGKPAAFFDERLHRLAAAGDLEIRLQETNEMRDSIAGSSIALPPRLEDGMRHRRLVAPVDIGERRCGWVVVAEHPARLNAFDEVALRRAAKHLALELAAARRATSSAWDARSLLARQLIRGTQEDDVRRGAEQVGVELDAPRVVGFLAAACSIDDEALVGALERRLTSSVLATKGPEGIALLLETAAHDAPLLAVRELKRVLGEACAELGLQAPLAGLSAVCRSHTDVPRGYREAREVARCIDHFPGHRVLAADDLGPARLFVANGDAPAIERFVEDVLGTLLTGEPAACELLRTLQCFFDCGRNIRHSAAELNVHENTVRYRLARVHALTGLDVAADASDQLSVQMSLLVLRLRDHPALPSFAEAA
jgi:sugar diacid utilization regulator